MREAPMTDELWAELAERLFLASQEGEGAHRYQFVTFAIHSADQPNVPCSHCGQAASWLLLMWYDREPAMGAVAYCGLHFPGKAGGDA